MNPTKTTADDILKPYTETLTILLSQKFVFIGACPLVSLGYMVLPLLMYRLLLSVACFPLTLLMLLF